MLFFLLSISSAYSQTNYNSVQEVQLEIDKISVKIHRGIDRIAILKQQQSQGGSDLQVNINNAESSQTTMAGEVLQLEELKSVMNGSGIITIKREVFDLLTEQQQDHISSLPQQYHIID